MTFLRSKIFLLFFLLMLLLVDFFVVPNIDPVCRTQQGYGFAYPLSQKNEQINQMRYGWPRIKYNFSHFFVFWTQPPFSKSFSNLTEFLTLDGNPIILNIGHFFAFFIFTLILAYFFRLPIRYIFLICLFFNIFHEYVSEGVCVDPSFNDLWVDFIGVLIGIVFYLIWSNFIQVSKFFKMKS